MSVIPFNHSMAAHCESGAITALVNHHGLKISEPLVFGISSGLFFGYMKTPMSVFPSIFTRIRPGKILNNFSQRTGISFKTKRYTNPDRAEKELDALLEQNQPVGVQVDFFYMDFFPSWNRVHINVHYLTIVGKEDDDYYVSDSYFPSITKISKESLRKGRFAGGSMAPKGFMFYPVHVPSEIDLKKGIRAGIKNTTYNMLKIPLPFLGVKGIRRFSEKVIEWPEYARDTDQLAHEIFKIHIMLEDQGTGGAGFRYIYASFLKEAAAVLSDPVFSEQANRMMEIGDNWRNISLFASRIAKNRTLDANRLKEFGGMIQQNADAELQFFTDLRKTIS